MPMQSMMLSEVIFYGRDANNGLIPVCSTVPAFLNVPSGKNSSHLSPLYPTGHL